MRKYKAAKKHKLQVEDLAEDDGRRITIEAAEELPGVTDAGEKLAVTPAKRPLTVSETGR